MRRLFEYQSVILHVGIAALPATVVATQGEEATLLMDGPIADSLPARPCAAQLSFGGGSHPIMLKGAVLDDVSKRLRFLGCDGVHKGDARARARLGISLAVTVKLPDGETLDTCSIDVSATGIQLACTGIRGRVALSITLPNDEVVTTFAHIVRNRGDTTALTFEAHARLDEFVLSVRCALAERFAEQRNCAAEAA